MKTVAIIPARLESQRLPRKALLDICGLPMIVHVFKRTELAKKLDAVYVATDNAEIAATVEKYGGKVLMTGSHHQTGSDRLAEAVAQIDCDIVVNVQGDEALVNPGYIDKVVGLMHENPAAEVALLVNPFTKRNSFSDIKVVLNEKNEVLYLSRSDIPSNCRTPDAPMLKAYHIVPFRKKFLLEYASWPKGKLEQIEYNEYLRILEKGRKIHTVLVESDAVSVDTEADLEFVRSKMKEDTFFALYQ